MLAKELNFFKAYVSLSAQTVESIIENSFDDKAG